MMSRRRVVVALAGCWVGRLPSLAAAASPAGRLYRIGYLNPESPANYARRLEVLREGLRELGYVEGKTFVIEARWAEGHYDRLPDLAQELVALKVDVIVTTGTKATVGARHATSTIPIVMGSAGDVVAAGIVASLARPGGNITGSINLGRELGPKRLELIREALPRAVRVGYLVNPENAAFGTNLQAMWKAARTLRLDVQPFEARNAGEIDAALAEMVKRRMEVLAVQDETSFNVNVQRILGGAMKHRLPSVGNLTFGVAGGLIGYGPDVAELDRRAAVFVDKILRGARPGDLPIEQPTKFDLVIGLRMARSLGVTVPASLVRRADRVIE